MTNYKLFILDSTNKFKKELGETQRDEQENIENQTLALRIRPKRWASWRLEPACDEIWITTLASGISMELSPTWNYKKKNKKKPTH